MDIKAAIFDCDGTILDSMPMWFDVFPSWLEQHHIDNAYELSERYEYMDFEEECFFFHDTYGVCPSREAALEEVKARVLKGYADQVEAFSSVGAFLEELKGAGVPMAILSSTTSSIVRDALALHGLDGYFDEIYYTGDIGFDKQHTEAYCRVCELLGAPIDSTWVFEDAPFGVTTAHTAGFPTVCLFNDHDGRDETYMREHSDILAHSWSELSYALLKDYERPLTSAHLCTEATGHPLKVLIVGGSPEPSSPNLVAQLATQADYIIAADGGAEVLQAAECAPNIFCGDSDSVSASSAAWAQDRAQATIAFPADKYATDLSLALDCAYHEASRQERLLTITVTCVSGGRLDHMLGVVGVLLSHVEACPRIVEDASHSFECRILSPKGTSTWNFEDNACGKTVSVVALNENTVASEQGFVWELDHAALPLLSDRGISNRVSTPCAQVMCHSGALACFLISSGVD